MRLLIIYCLFIILLSFNNLILSFLFELNKKIKYVKKTDIIPKTIAKTIIALLGLSFNIGSKGGSIMLNANSLLILAKRIVLNL